MSDLPEKVSIEAMGQHVYDTAMLNRDLIHWDEERVGAQVCDQLKIHSKMYASATNRYHWTYQTAIKSGAKPSNAWLKAQAAFYETYQSAGWLPTEDYDPSKLIAYAAGGSAYCYALEQGASDQQAMANFKQRRDLEIHQNQILQKENELRTRIIHMAALNRLDELDLTCRRACQLIKIRKANERSMEQLDPPPHNYLVEESYRIFESYCQPSTRR